MNPTCASKHPIKRHRTFFELLLLVVTPLSITAMDAPTLGIHIDGNQIVLESANGVLQETTSLSPENWVTLNSTTATISLQPSDSQHFYRVTQGDQSWMTWTFGCDDGHDNTFQLQRDGTPVCGSRNCTNPGGLPGTAGTCWQNPTLISGLFGPGSLEINHPKDVQMYGKTYLYAASTNTIQGVPFVADVGRVWLNDQEITSNPIRFDFRVGWNKLEFTSYNQNQDTSLTIPYPFGAQYVVDSSGPGETLTPGDSYWRVWSFGCDDGHDNVYQLERDGTPICSSRNCPNPGGLPETPGTCWQNPVLQSGSDGPGSLDISQPQDVQLYGRTFLYVDQPKVLASIPWTADVGRVWLNDSEVTAGDLTFKLTPGWNKVEFTSYNQNQPAVFRIRFPLAENVIKMSSTGQ